MYIALRGVATIEATASVKVSALAYATLLTSQIRTIIQLTYYAEIKPVKYTLATPLVK